MQKANYLAKGKIRGPETILIINDTIYTGLLNGQIVRINKDDSVQKVVQVGQQNKDICS